MRVHVDHVIDATRRLVQCTTSYGTLRLVWGVRSLPDGGAIDVELAVPETLEWGRRIWHAAEGGQPGPDGALLSGTLLQLDGSGVAEIQLRDGVLLVETIGEAPPGAVGQAVELSPPRIDAYPYEL